MKKKFARYLLLGAIVAIITTYLLPDKKQADIPSPRDYSEIQQDGTLRASTEYNSLGFYVDGDTLSGFHYELINAFARAHGLKLSLTPEMSFEKRIQALEKGSIDIIACDLLATTQVKDSLMLTHPILQNREVLVQRKITTPADSSRFVRTQLDLAGKTLHIVKGSPVSLRIHNLANEIADTIYIEEIEKYGPEQLVSLVAHGDIDYTVCNESIARSAADSLPQIDLSTAISFTQFYAWAVSKHSPVLLDSLNTWLEQFQKTKEYKQLYRKYY